MMIHYPGLKKLKTKLIVYQDVISASDCGTLEQLKELSSRRKAIEDSINENSHVTEAIAREISGGLTSRCEQDVQRLEHYLPLLENFIHNVYGNPPVSCWMSDLKIRWSSTLASSSIFHRGVPKNFQVNNLYFELAMSVFLYGAMLREQALEVLSTDLVQSATLFRKSAGVYNYLAQRVVNWLIESKERPPEATYTVSSTMSLVCLADAQAVTARKAEENGKSGTLLAKLHYGVTEFLVEAIDILQASEECKDLSSRLLDFLLSCKILHELKSCKHLVMSLKDDGKIGVAIGLLHHALAKVKKSTPKEESWKLVFKQVIDDLTVLLKKYEHENNFVWYEKVPRNDELPLPQSAKIVSLIPYEPQKLERTLIFKS